MRVTPITTRRVEAGSTTVQSLLDSYLQDLSDGGVVVVTAKIVSLCEGRIAGEAEATETAALRRVPGVNCDGRPSWPGPSSSPRT